MDFSKIIFSIQQCGQFFEWTLKNGQEIGTLMAGTAAIYAAIKWKSHKLLDYKIDSLISFQAQVSLVYGSTVRVCSRIVLANQSKGNLSEFARYKEKVLTSIQEQAELSATLMKSFKNLTAANVADFANIEKQYTILSENDGYLDFHVKVLFPDLHDQLPKEIFKSHKDITDASSGKSIETIDKENAAAYEELERLCTEALKSELS